MKDKEYDKRRQEIVQATAGEVARFRRELAMLSAESGWSALRIAAKEGLSQRAAGYRCLFGRFLTSGTNVPDRISEGSFRAIFDMTSGNESERFAQVVASIGTPKKRATGIADAVVEILKGGEPYFPGRLFKEVRKTLPEVTIKQVRTALMNIRKKPPAGLELRSRAQGGDASYRLVPPYDFVQQVFDRLTPLINGLEASAAMSFEFRTMFEEGIRMIRRELDTIVAEAAVEAAKKVSNEVAS